MISPEDFDVIDPEQVVQRILTTPRGPMPGYGRGPGRPWRGVVEETPALWVTWFTHVCKRVGRDPGGLKVRWAGVPLSMETVRLTFGDRFYWRCPRCGRRCEVVYNRGSVGCRVCLRLGFKSQTQRASSPYFWFDRLFSRDWFWRGPRWQPSDDIEAFVVGELGGHFRAQVETAISELEVETDNE